MAGDKERQGPLPPSPENVDLGATMIKGSAWMIAMRWSMRALGLVSTAILARLLTPEDFGIVAVSVAIIGFLDALTDIGADMALIRHTAPERWHYDTVWTLTLLVHLFSALLILGFSFAAPLLYDDPRYQPVLALLALSIFIGGLQNIGTVDFRRDLHFHLDFRYALYTQFSSVILTLLLAWIYQTYWALVWGIVVRSLLSVAFSYGMHPYRPRLSLAAREEMLGFSLWISLRSVGIYLSERGERLIIGAFYSPHAVGLYSVASDLSQMVTSELILPIGRALLPGLARLQQERDWVAKSFPRVLNVTATLSIAAGLGLAAVAEEFVGLIYGERFADAAAIVEILALASAVYGFSQPVSQYLVIDKRERDLAILFLLQAAVLLGVVYMACLMGSDIGGIAQVRFWIVLLTLGRLFYLIRIIKNIGGREVFWGCLRPLVAGGAMFAAIFLVRPLLGFGEFVSLIVLILLGALVFITLLLLLWRISGRPAGIESEVLRRLPVRGDGPAIS